MIDLNLVKQVTDLVDWFASLPMRLVEAVMGTRAAYLTSKEKIAKLKELEALRDIGGTLSYLYLTKGNIYTWINTLQRQGSVEGADYIRELFTEAAGRLGEIQTILTGLKLSDLALAAEASRGVANAKSTFERLAALSDTDILGDRGLINIIGYMDEIISSGTFLENLANHHRKELESSLD